jgi:ribonuclease-3
LARRLITPDQFEDPPSTARGAVVSIRDIEAVVGMAIPDDARELFLEAFTHKSAVRPRDPGSKSYERLEFMGDSTLNRIIAKYLFETFPNEDEGFLTRVRTKIVSGKFLSVLAWRMGLHTLVMMNQEALSKGWNANPNILEDVFEALVGAVDLSVGFVAARDFVLAAIARHGDMDSVLVDTNHKDRLTRFLRKMGMPLATYESRESRDSSSSRAYVVEVVIEDVVLARGTAMSKKDAEQAAALSALDRLGVPQSIIQSKRG